MAKLGGWVIVQDQNIKFKILWSQGWVKSFKTNDKMQQIYLQKQYSMVKIENFPLIIAFTQVNKWSKANFS